MENYVRYGILYSGPKHYRTSQFNSWMGPFPFLLSGPFSHTHMTEKKNRKGYNLNLFPFQKVCKYNLEKCYIY